MTRDAYLLACLNNGTFRFADWVFSVFTVVRDRDYKKFDLDKYNSELYPLALYHNYETNQYCYLTEDEWTDIEGTDITKPLFDIAEGFKIESQDDLIQPVKKGVTFPFVTRVGTLFTNYYCLVSAFDNKIEYQDGKLTISGLEKIVLSKLEDAPDDLKDRQPDQVYPDEVKAFSSACSSMGGFAIIASPSATPYTMVAAPGIKEYREQLLNQYRDKLLDPAIVALIEKKLVEYDRNFQAQDPEGGFLQSKKVFEVSRKKMYGIHGLEMSDISSGNPVIITNSLSEGWDVNNLPAMIDSLRSGSFNRGALTALGGEAVKFIFRIFATTSITEEDCKSKVGVLRKITHRNHHRYIGNTIILPEGQIELTEDNLRYYIDKEVYMRTTGYCKTGNANFCLTCSGKLLKGSENAIPALTSKVGSKMLDIFMAKMHGVALTTTPWNIRDTLS